MALLHMLFFSTVIKHNFLKLCILNVFCKHKPEIIQASVSEKDKQVFIPISSHRSNTRMITTQYMNRSYNENLNVVHEYTIQGASDINKPSKMDPNKVFINTTEDPHTCIMGTTIYNK